jgi:hypothetical protein
VRFRSVDSVVHDGAKVRRLWRTRASHVLDTCWTAPT